MSERGQISTLDAPRPWPAGVAKNSEQYVSSALRLNSGQSPIRLNSKWTAISSLGLATKEMALVSSRIFSGWSSGLGRLDNITRRIRP
jgi:hypothetical protein